jgi:hypothetical protein
MTHFEIWAASQISEVMVQSHRIWQSNSSAAHVARFMEPPGGGGGTAGLPFANGPPSALLAVFAVFCSETSAKSDMVRVLASAGQNEPRYLFHLFYHVQIRLGSALPGLPAVLRQQSGIAQSIAPER